MQKRDQVRPGGYSWLHDIVHTHITWPEFRMLSHSGGLDNY